MLNEYTNKNAGIFMARFHWCFQLRFDVNYGVDVNSKNIIDIEVNTALPSKKELTAHRVELRKMAFIYLGFTVTLYSYC